ncbi:MAG: DNA double-strand break repair nuclease NurA, partial [Anaerolineae bacterium]|nr:DNA double-strand break repair nuclease NurA [Anaerolineae bacterium]
MTPLYADRVAQALRSKGGDFEESQRDIVEDMQRVHDALAVLERMSREQLEQAIATISRPGARPTAEQDELPLVQRFGTPLDDHRQAREWARDRLAGVTTFAADGSQIFPSKDMSIPVGLVQVGWFENRHDAEGTYVKDVQVDVLTPQELSRSFEPGYAEREIEWRRFYSEVLRTRVFMEQHQGQPALAFFDGSLILSFVDSMRESRQRQYIDLVHNLIAYSEQTGVPVVGFVDSTQAADLTSL